VIEIVKYYHTSPPYLVTRALLRVALRPSPPCVGDGVQYILSHLLCAPPSPVRLITPCPLPHRRSLSSLLFLLG